MVTYFFTHSEEDYQHGNYEHYFYLNYFTILFFLKKKSLMINTLRHFVFLFLYKPLFIGLFLQFVFQFFLISDNVLYHTLTFILSDNIRNNEN